MDGPTQDEIPQQLSLQQQAIDEAKLAYSRLPHDHAIFRQCVEGKQTLAEVLGVVEQRRQSHKKKKSNKLLSRLQKYTTWLQNMSAVVDVAVQTQAGFACPLWAPIKFILQISNDHSKATEQIFNLLESITESLPRLEIYQWLQSDGILQVALLNIFTDVVDFSVRAIHFFQQGTFVRLTQTVVRSFDRDIGAVIARLERHARIADQTAVATELLGAAQFRKESDQRQYEELKIQCERWLKASDVKHIHLHQVQAKLDGTCEWVTLNVVFENWIKAKSLTTQDRLLVMSGSHGCGKSIYSPPQYSDGNRKTSESLIRTLLWQILQQSDKRECVDAVNSLRLDGQPSVSELWDAFEHIIPLFAKPKYCVIDGVDECIDHNHTLFTRLVQTLENCPNLRVLLLGRSYVIQAHSGSCAFTAIEITPAMLSQDIEAFTNNEIAKSDILSLPEFRETVYKSLSGKSHGMFLWVRLMVDDLRRSSSKSEFSQRLQDLPHGLEKAYQLHFLRLSQKLDKFERRLAQTVLAFTIISCQPMTFVEFRYAYALHCRSLDTVARPFEEYLLLQPLQRILNLTEGLLYMTDGVLRLSHSSVRDFLVRSEDRWIGEIDKAVLDFRIDFTQTHRSFAWLCLDHIGLETNASKALKLDTSHNARAVRGSSPLLRYATLYAFHHLNRSGPPCSVTLAKVEHLLKSTNIIVHAEHFLHLVFEDVTLHAQMDEFTAWEDQMVDAGLERRLLTIFEGTLRNWTDQMRQAGRGDDPLIELLEVYLSEAKDRQSGASSEGSHEIAISVLDSDTAGQHLQTLTTNSRQSSNESSATVYRVMDLLKCQTPLPVAHQIELCVRLSTSLRKLRKSIDPLKALFQFILRGASRIPVYALLLVGGFYYNLGKFQEALEVLDAASKKTIHLDVLLRFEIYEHMADCHDGLKSDVDALKFYEKAFSGYETLLGIRHLDTLRILYRIGHSYCRLGSYTEALRSYEKAFSSYKLVRGLRHLDTLRTLEGMADCYYQEGLYLEALRSYEEVFSGYEVLRGTRHVRTLRVLKYMIDMNVLMNQHTEVIRLTNQIYIEHGSIPELNLHENLDINCLRHRACFQIGDHDGEAAMETCSRGDLDKVRQSYSNHNDMLTCDMPTEILYSYGFVNHSLREYETALQSFELALKAYERSKETRSRKCLDTRWGIARAYEKLGQHREARVQYETLLAKQESILGPSHPNTRNTKRCLENLMLNSLVIVDDRSDNVEDDGDEATETDTTATVG